MANSKYSGFVDATPNKKRSKHNNSMSREELKRQHEKEDDKSFWSTWLIGFGGCFLMLSLLGGIDFGIFLVAIAAISAGILIKIYPMMKQRKKQKYDGVINYRGNTSLYDIANHMNKSVEAVSMDLQAMIKDGYFYDETNGHDAYIDREIMMLVMTKDDIPIKNPEETVKKQQFAEQYKNDSSFVKDIREAIDTVDDERMTNCLYDLEGSVRRIENQIKKKPELKSNADIVKLNNYYLPEIIKIVKKYVEGQTPGIMAAIEDALETCASGLEGIEKEISEAENASTEIDIKVLKDTFKRDGLLGSDFDLNH